ncbi:vitelline membrane protein Vm32E-like [Lucilia cuprina]|uniref:vitelline membrane protein Vm32E-like n=1 Tax=Lucilia cuprina TaxID=7375 RepID=UPI000C71AF8F|nr:vitelline membrane protein Vm32E-like [Lucilia cuprina]
MNTIATVFIVAASLAVVAAGGYGGGSPAASIPAPPCPKNYLFSCQPNLAPAPCAPPAAGSAGAYSENIPTIITAPYGYQGLPQQLNQYPNYYGQFMGGN